MKLLTLSKGSKRVIVNALKGLRERKQLGYHRRLSRYKEKGSNRVILNVLCALREGKQLGNR